MKKTFPVVVALAAMLASRVFGQQEIPDFDEEQKVTGAAAVAISKAVPEAEHKGVEVAKYRVIFAESETKVYVLFIDPHRFKKGDFDRVAPFEVELNKSDLKVTSAHWSK